MIVPRSPPALSLPALGYQRFGLIQTVESEQYPERILLADDELRQSAARLFPKPGRGLEFASVNCCFRLDEGVVIPIPSMDGEPTMRDPSESSITTRGAGAVAPHRHLAARNPRHFGKIRSLIIISF